MDRRRFRRNERRWRKAEKVVELEVVGGDDGAADHDRGEQIVAEQRGAEARQRTKAEAERRAEEMALLKRLQVENVRLAAKL